MFQPLSRAEARSIRALHRRKEREVEGLFLAEGVRVVEELVSSGLVIELALISPGLEKSERGRALIESLEPLRGLREVDDRTLSSLAGTKTPQGILAIAQTPRRELTELDLPGAATILVLDGVQDPGNFGTLARTADALGAVAVVTLPGTVDPWNTKAVRAAAGATFRIPVVEAGYEELLTWLEDEGVRVYGAAAEGEDAGKTEFGDRAALVVGNEGAGLSKAMMSSIDRLVAVPIGEHAESLNVAVATGILLFIIERLRRRGSQGCRS